MMDALQNRWGGGHTMSWGGRRHEPYLPSSTGWVSVIAAFVLGALVGMMGGKKATLIKTMGGTGAGWKGMMHHHHGLGSKACCEQHEKGETAAPHPGPMPRDEGE